MQELEETPYLKPSTQDQMYTNTLTFPVPSLLGVTYHRYYMRSPPSHIPSLCSPSCKYVVKF